jgi:hypothetical protein
MASFYESLKEVFNASHEKQKNDCFMKLLSTVFEGSNDKLLEAIPEMKAAMLEQVQHKACVSASFVHDIDLIMNDVGMGLTIIIPESYNHYLMVRNKPYMVNEKKVLQDAILYNEEVIFASKADQNVIMRYICEFVPEVRKLLETVKEQFDGEYAVKCDMYRSNTTSKVVFEITVTYTFALTSASASSSCWCSCNSATV